MKLPIVLGAAAGRLKVLLGAAAGRLKAFASRVAVKMLASAFISFTIVFVTASSVLLLFELIPWLVREGVTDIDPLPILIVSFIVAFAAMYVRFLLMKRFSGIRP